MAQTQDFNPAIDFEPDPWALQSILTSAGLAPGTLEPQFKAGTRANPSITISTSSSSGLTPAAKVSKHYEQFDCFQGPQGHVFFRPKTPSSRTKASGNRGAPSGPRQRAWDRGVALSARPKRIEVARIPLAPQTDGKNMPGWPRNRPPLLAQSSISERKTLMPAGPDLDVLRRESVARKTLDFGRKGGTDSEKENDLTQAERIRIRESLLALPRPGLSDWLRNSLTPAELDRMFEDDSTESFEAWEKRLKTPKPTRPPTVSIRTREAEKATLKSEPSPEATPFLERLAAEMDPPTCPTLPLTPESESKPTGPPKTTPESVLASSEPAELSEDDSSGRSSPVFEIVVENPEPDSAISAKFGRSMSLGDVSIIHEVEENEENGQSVGTPRLKTASSESDLTQARCTQDFLLEALQAHQDFMAEQDRIQEQINALMNKAQTRRSEFRGLWGVSPRSISQVRSLKTVLGQHKVQFSRPSVPNSPVPTSSSISKTTDESDLVFSPQLEPLDQVFSDLEHDLDEGEDQTMSFEDMEMTPCRGVMVRNKKRVHFSTTTPIRHVITPSPSPMHLKVNVPLLIGQRNGQQGQKSTSFIYTPVFKHGKTMRRSFLMGENEDDAEDNVEEDSPKIPMNTPMALQSLSRKVQAELALLYEDDEPDKDSVDARENLNFDE